MKLANGAETLKTRRNNKTIYICVGSRDGVSAGQRANMKSHGALWLDTSQDPLCVMWPVFDCGVIVLDYEPMTEHTAQCLGLALKRDGALPGTIWVNQISNDSSVIV